MQLQACVGDTKLNDALRACVGNAKLNDAVAGVRG